MLGGLVAGEGWFANSLAGKTFADGSRRRRFIFGMTMASRDRPLLEALRAYLGAGSISDHPPRNPKWLPQSSFSVRSHTAHRQITIPFAETFLLAGAKRHQFERWRDDLAAYETAHPNRMADGRSVCSEPDCDKPVRGRGLCRSHYYRATGY